MLPAGAPTEATLAALADLLAAGDALLDGGNSHFKDDVRRARSSAPAASTTSTSAPAAASGGASAATA